MKKAATVFGSLAVALGGTLLVAPAAHAATCWGSGCYGLDPNAAGCGGDAYTAASAQTSQGLVELRYSPSCNANWARISSSSPGTWFEVADCQSPYQAQSYNVPSGYASGWTNMVDGSPTAQAIDDAGGTACV